MDLGHGLDVITSTDEVCQYLKPNVYKNAYIGRIKTSDPIDKLDSYARASSHADSVEYEVATAKYYARSMEKRAPLLGGKRDAITIQAGYTGRDAGRDFSLIEHYRKDWYHRRSTPPTFGAEHTKYQYIVAVPADVAADIGVKVPKNWGFAPLLTGRATLEEILQSSLPEEGVEIDLLGQVSKRCGVFGSFLFLWDYFPVVFQISADLTGRWSTAVERRIYLLIDGRDSGYLLADSYFDAFYVKRQNNNVSADDIAKN